ncbi:zinc finger MYM-type protein 3 [Acyrthosiphon pisum]|uniref:TRASH domain-containing protein n=1 Tax=Acyrthosiphon pisum TaxID=7029 RepID=A0A8R1W2Q5_ACYPI|nr:zinc finger MYM-type protein 3 [Acyrthosiphon pisum]|eukprot:XP_001943720.2 PREDICTED: zinc finger MYM-type protein 3 [Acyrthosiphon pisum]
MADDLNAEAASSATASENNELIIPFDESLELIHSDTTDKEHMEDVTPDNCAIISVDIIEPIGSSSEVINSSIMTTEHDISNEDLEIKVDEKNINEKLLVIDSENKLDQIDTGVTKCLDNDEPAMSVPNVENKIMESISKIEINIDQADQIVEPDITDPPTIDILSSIRNNDSNEYSGEDKIMNEECLIQNNMILNSETHQKHQSQNDLSESLLKTSSRPQRQAAKKAENQIREIAKEIIKPIESIDDKIIDTVEELSSPLKKVCCQCNRFRLCKFTVNDHKSIYLCQEECVENYRKKNIQCDFEKKCQCCQSVILENEDKSYYWQTKHFCSVKCLREYQKTVFDSHCKNCQNVITSDVELQQYCRYISGKLLEFCGAYCTESYENRLSLCGFCQKDLVDCDFEDFCSSFCQTKDYESRKKHTEPDSSVVDYGSNEKTQVIDICNVCFCKLNSSPTNEFQILSNTNSLFKFCSNECLNKFIVSKKRTVSCSLCKVKKFNIDMISTKNVSSNSPTYMCSTSCIDQQNQLAAAKFKQVCDHCGFLCFAHYNTIHNGTIYNFCSQKCLNSFQPEKNQKSKSKSKNGKKSSASRISTRQSARKEDNNVDSDGVHNSQQKTFKVKQKVGRKISHKNAVSKVDKEVQTDQTGSKAAIIPIPVPVYIPMPMHMYVMPYPVPVPFPIPLPIPIFIPTTKNTTKAIMKDIKKIREETPADPFEAELLLMANMVANDLKPETVSSSDSENDLSNNEYNDDTKVVSSSARNINSFGDDVLAIALNMAGADTESLEGADEISNDQRNQIIDDVEANLVSSTIMPQTPDPMENITQENMISSPQDMLCRPPRKRAPRSQSQRNSNSKRSRKTEYPQAQCIPAGLIQQVVQNPLYTIPMTVVKPDANMCLKYTLGVNAWKQWACTKSIEFEKTLSSYVCGVKKTNIFKLDLLQLTANELNYCLCLFVKEVRKPNGSEYAPDTIYYLCLGVQQYLFENGRIDNIFTDVSFEKFTDTLNEIAKRFTELYNDTKYIVTRVEEEYLWESKQLGAHSPYVLLCTLIFFNTKHFNLTSVEEHMQLSFSHIMKHWKRNPNQPSTSGVKAPGTYRNVLLRFYPPQASIDSPNSRKKKVYEQHENEENSLRCPVKLYEFYLSKCPESVKTRNDLFYLTPERSCVPDSPVWYSTCALNKESLEKMLNRVKMVKEINVALLSS